MTTKQTRTIIGPQRNDKDFHNRLLFPGHPSDYRGHMDPSLRPGFRKESHLSELIHNLRELIKPGLALEPFRSADGALGKTHARLGVVRQKDSVVG